MPSIADVYVSVLPETSKIGDGIRRAFREADPVARDRACWSARRAKKVTAGASRRPPSVVDVRRGCHRRPRRRSGDSGPVCASVSHTAVAEYAAVAAPGPVP